MNEWQGKPKYSEKICSSASLSTTYPTHDLPRSRTRAVAVGSRRLTDRATAQNISNLTRGIKKQSRRFDSNIRNGY
jgi:hypothetical protein